MRQPRLELELLGRQHHARAVAEADAVPVANALGVHDDGVAVLDHLALRAARELDRLRPLPRELDHGAVRPLRGARDRAGGDDVAWAHVASVDAVVGELLEDAPVHVLVVGVGDDHRVALLGVDRHRQVDVVVARRRVAQVRQRLRLGLRGAGDAEGLKGEGRDDPRRDGRAEVLAQERAERDVLPLLDVARTPVIEGREAEDLLVRLGDRDRLAELVAGADVRGHLELEVDGGRRAERRGRLRVGTLLPVGARQRGAADDDGGRAAVVPDGDVQPVLEQRGRVGAEHLAEVRGVLAGGVAVGVVANVRRQHHLHVTLADERGALERLVAGKKATSGQSARDGVAGLLPRVVVEAHERVHRRLLQSRCDLRREHALLARQDVEVKDEVANGDADVRGVTALDEHAIRQVLDRERVIRDVLDDARHDRSWQ
mmetsp:Transcript_5796/g.18243  ORF Transcript_5796/g.18243 Transcript_5796/m.18243 type:complete len:430 (-) Transcript_5796:18-1307(-)